MTTHLKLVGKLTESIQGSNNKLKSYQILQQLFGYQLRFEIQSEKNNVLLKYLSAIDKLTSKEGYYEFITDDYISAYKLVNENLVVYFDDSKKLFEITIPKDFKMTEKDTGIRNLEYKGTDILKGFKRFLNKVLPELDVYLESTNQYTEQSFLEDIKKTMIFTDINYINNVDYECRILKPKMTTTEISLEISELYLDICNTLGKEIEYSNVKSYLYKCNCETCLSYAKTDMGKNALMFDIEFVRE